jgi:ankyrin
VSAKNGYTALHIASKKNQLDIATTLLEYSAKTNCKSIAGFTSFGVSGGPHRHGNIVARTQCRFKFDFEKRLDAIASVRPDKVNCAAILVKYDANIDPETKAGYTPLHVACHFGQINMVRFLLQNMANVNIVTHVTYPVLKHISSFPAFGMSFFLPQFISMDFRHCIVLHNKATWLS